MLLLYRIKCKHFQSITIIIVKHSLTWYVDSITICFVWFQIVAVRFWCVFELTCEYAICIAYTTISQEPFLPKIHSKDTSFQHFNNMDDNQQQPRKKSKRNYGREKIEEDCIYFIEDSMQRHPNYAMYKHYNLCEIEMKVGSHTIRRIWKEYNENGEFPYMTRKALPRLQRFIRAFLRDPR